MEKQKVTHSKGESDDPVLLVCVLVPNQKNIQVQYTVRSTDTGVDPCTMVVFDLSSKWGYWDVRSSLDKRVILGLLGVE